VVFGIGAVVGPAITGHLADRIGFAHALRLALVVQTAAVALPSLAAGSVWLIVSSLVVGAMVPGIVPLVLGRVHELATADQQDRTAAWSFATVAFALGQASAAYGLSFLFAQAGDGYVTLFALGAGALALALTIDLVAALGGRRSGAPPQSRR
jgi:predicted MFS family arabinose efflux permease